ncbi:hypothetical protein SADUNF_Sadunf17G0093500 [Salix dunnii]|uniref:Uncharacterized protein n=1 Tax=Salix dunnii TaxID=1413687 RepID=A0A835J6A4_9ROSI|nr:hypothetical protein SADUNF_Sadunf17G0093500 [Salix dunnii]
MTSKRPPPTSVVSGGIRPPKIRKAEPILSSLKVYEKKASLILNIKVNHGLDKFGLRVVVIDPQGNTALVLKIQKSY